MRKKFLSVILSFVLAFSVSVGTAAYALPSGEEIAVAIRDDFLGSAKAVQKLRSLSVGLMKSIGPYMRDVVLTSDNIKTAEELAEKLAIRLLEKLKPSSPDNPDNPDKPVKPDKPDKPTEPTKPNIGEKLKVTAGKIVDIFQKYIFVKVDDVKKSASEILEDSEFTYTTVNGSDGTLYIRVNIKDNPDIFNYQVFRDVVEGLCKQQDEILMSDKNGKIDYIMTYEHIAGELAFHEMVYAVSNEIVEATGTKNETILKLYESAANADLNIDEARLPSEFISILGVLLVDFIQLHFMKLFGIVQ